MVFFVASPPRGLPYSYFLYSIGFYEAFRAFFLSYYNSHKFVKLNESEDAALLAEIRTAITVAFPVPGNELEPKLIDKFFNACHRVFGSPPPYPDKTVFNQYSKPAIPAPDFFSELEKGLVQIGLSIVELGTTEVKLGNYYTIAEILNNLKSLLANNIYNDIGLLTIEIYDAFVRLLNLLRNDDLMVKRLNFRGIDELERGTELCRLVGKPVAENPRAIASLADVLDFFLQEWVAKKQWDQNEVQKLDRGR